MKMKSYFLPLLAVLLCACNHQPTVYHAPPAAKLVARQQSAARHVVAAQVKFAAASVGLRATKASQVRAVASQAEATRWVTLVVPAVEELLLKVPADLKPEVEALKLKVAALSAEIDRTTGEMAVTTKLIGTTQADQSSGTAELEQGTADIHEINAKLAPAHFADVETLAAHATAESQEKADWHNKYDALNRETWMHRLLGIASALILCGLAFLWFTGRLAGAGARAAAAAASVIR